MIILKRASAGTLESSDVFVEVAEGAGTVDIQIDSVVKRQFGEAIERTVRDVCCELGVDSASIYLSDRGALDCTVRARVETALRRGGEAQQA